MRAFPLLFLFPGKSISEQARRIAEMMRYERRNDELRRERR